MSCRRIFTLVLIAICLVVPQVSFAKESVNLHVLMWAGDPTRFWVEQVKRLDDANPDITVSVTQVAWGKYTEQLQVMIASGAAPDVAMVHDSFITGYADKRLLRPLTPYMKANPIDTDDFWAPALNAFKWKGTQYSIPYDLANLGLYYNKDMLDTAGIAYPDGNWTWHDLRLNAIKLSRPQTANTTVTFGFQPILPNQLHLIYYFVASYGGNFFNADHSVSNFDSQEIENTISFLTNLQNTDRAMGGLFTNGTAGLTWQFPGFGSGLIKATFGWDVAPAPIGPAGRAIAIAGSSFGLPTGSAHPEEGWQIVKWLSGPEVQKSLAEDGRVPARKSRLRYAKPSTGVPVRFREAFIDTLSENAPIVPFNPKWAEIEAIWVEEMKPVMAGTTPPKYALSRIKSKADQLLSGK